jgi:hypothetical protein
MIHRLERDGEAVGDLGVGQALGHQQQDFSLPGG